MKLKSSWAAWQRQPAVAVIFVLCLPLSLVAQPSKVTVQTPSRVTAKRGSTVEQTLEVSVQDGFHVNSNKPRDEFIIPLKLSWADGPLVAKMVNYPPAEDVKVGNDTLSVFTRQFAIKTSFTVPQQTPAGATMVNGKLRFQACSNQMCLRPQTVEVHLSVEVQ